MGTERRLPIVETAVTGAHFSLTPFTEKDVSDRYIKWLSDPEVNRFLEVRFTPQTPETARSFVRSFYSDAEKYLWGIRLCDTRELIGTATLHSISRRHGWGHFGLMIGDQQYWGKGASTEAFRMLAEFAFERIGLRRLTGGTYATNHAMNFTLRRLGFKREGTFRQAFWQDDGTYIDEYRWSLLADEWRTSEDSKNDRED